MNSIVGIDVCSECGSLENHTEDCTSNPLHYICEDCGVDPSLGPHKEDCPTARKILGSLGSNSKPSNPKDTVGIRKVPLSTISAPVIAELGVAMLEGALKYGRHNYREVGVRASVYYDAVGRHIEQWWEGEDIDQDSGLSHITKAIASLVVLRDSMIRGNWVDDRPPRMPDGWMKELNNKVTGLLEKYPDPVPPFTQKSIEH